MLINTIQELRERYPNFEIRDIETSGLIFEKRVKLNCFYCNKYNVNWKCPPRIPDLDYQELIAEYQNGCFVYKVWPVSEETFALVRHESTNLLHKTLLSMEKMVFSLSKGLCVSFIGGSCKLCKGGCGSEHCNNPYNARMPLEAAGVNVVASAKKYDINIQFPVKDTLTRLGLLLW